MNIIDIEIGNKLVHYRFRLERRISFLRGNSATGKTTFADLVRNKADNREIVFSCIDCDDVLSVNNVDFELMIRNSKNVVFVIDDLDIVARGLFSRLIKECCIKNNLCFLIITRREGNLDDDGYRDYGKSLSYSINSVYELEEKGGEYVLKPHYSFPQWSLRLFDIIVTEDSGTGLVFFSNIFGDKKVVSAKSGKSTIVDDVNQYVKKGCKNILVLFDSAGFGCHMEEFRRRFERGIDCNVSIMSMYECFEEVLCCARMLSGNAILQQELSNLHEYANNFVSWGTYFEDLIARATAGKRYSHSHGSSILSDCYTKSCDECDSRISSKCAVRMPGDKLEAIFRGTKYEFILDLKKFF